MEPLKINIEVSLSDATLRKLAVLLRGVHVDAQPAQKTTSPDQKKEEVKPVKPAEAPVVKTEPVKSPSAPAKDADKAEDSGDLPMSLKDLQDLILEVREKLGTAAPIKAVFAKYHASKGSDVPADQYEACAKDLKALLDA